MAASKKKPRTKKRRTDTSLAEMRKEVLDLFVAKAQRPLTASGQAALAAMFDITLARFKRSTASKAPGLDLWKTKGGKFRAFILNETRKIANAARAEAGSGSIDAKALNDAGLKVMLKTNTHCQVAISGGRLILDAGQFHGPVCSAFLEQQAV
jgi:hypothetical protein